MEIWKKKCNKKNQGTKENILGTLYYIYLTGLQDRYLVLEPLYRFQYLVKADLW